MSHPLVRFWYAVALAFVACMAVAAGSVAYTAHVQQRNDQRWCSLFAALNPGGTPPTNERGRVVADEIANLSREFRCPQR